MEFYFFCHFKTFLYKSIDSHLYFILKRHTFSSRLFMLIHDFIFRFPEPTTSRYVTWQRQGDGGRHWQTFPPGIVKLLIQRRHCFVLNNQRFYAAYSTNNEINHKSYTWFSALVGGQHIVKLTTSPFSHQILF